MTLNYGIFDVSDPLNPDRVYSAALLSRILSKHIRDGIVHGDGGELAVTASDPPAMSVQVGTGTAMVQGRFCESDASLTLPVTSAHASYPRIDRVVVRLSASPARTIDIVVKPGTAAPSPVPPGLTRTAEVWELSLAQVRVEAGATLIASAKITDERGDASLCGVAAPAYLPSSQLEVVGAVNMRGQALTGLPAPSGATDAARKGYVDTEIAGAIGGFGISQIAIDADKDWNGKSIVNVDNIVFAHTMHVLGNDPLVFAGTSCTVIGSFRPPGEAKIKIHVSGYTYNHYNPVGPRTITLYKNGVAIKTLSQGAVGSGEYHTNYPETTLLAFESYPLNPNDTFTATTTHGDIIAIEFHGSIGVVSPPSLII